MPDPATFDGLARIAHPSSIPVFTSRLADKDPQLRRAAAEGLGRSGDTSQMPALETAAGNDPSDVARAAMAFALQKLGRNYVPRLVEFLDDGSVALQVLEYFVELGQPVETELIPSLPEFDAPIRASVAAVLGRIGGDASLAALQGLQEKDKSVADAISRAVERIKMRPSTTLRAP